MFEDQVKFDTEPHTADGEHGPLGARLDAVGVVVIGRNEGDRLRRCLNSLAEVSSRLVYVDSGSIDESLIVAATRSRAIVSLDTSRPFTAARARNAGVHKLIELVPSLEYVFFVDGDCEVATDWLRLAAEFIATRAQVAVVTGIRRERYPERSIYNRLCDFEWSDRPIGEEQSCGGDALMRLDAFRQVGGFNELLICGEEPELCLRLRQQGWIIWRLPVPMTIHDAAMDRFSQWWRRTMRGGYGFALGASLHGFNTDSDFAKKSARIWLWAFGLPLTTIGLSTRLGSVGLVLALAYPLQIARLTYRGRRTPVDNLLRASAITLGKFPEWIGQCKFLVDRLSGHRPTLIEYK